MKQSIEIVTNTGIKKSVFADELFDNIDDAFLQLKIILKIGHENNKEKNNDYDPYWDDEKAFYRDRNR